MQFTLKQLNRVCVGVEQLMKSDAIEPPKVEGGEAANVEPTVERVWLPTLMAYQLGIFSDHATPHVEMYRAQTGKVTRKYAKPQKDEQGKPTGRMHIPADTAEAYERELEKIDNQTVDIPFRRIPIKALADEQARIPVSAMVFIAPLFVDEQAEVSEEAKTSKAKKT